MAAYEYSHNGARAATGHTRIRWDRLGRIAMLCVLGALLYLYIHAGVSLLSSWQESNRTSASVGAMRVQYRQLEAERAQLQSGAWIEMQARRLGMVFPGERQYFVRGLPGN
jgi:cell division protein FtsB